MSTYMYIDWNHLIIHKVLHQQVSREKNTACQLLGRDWEGKGSNNIEDDDAIKYGIKAFSAFLWN